MYKPFLRAAGLAGVVLIAHATAGCSQVPDNASLYSIKQPVVERSVTALDLTAAGDGLPSAEQRRLGDWLRALDLGYGDEIAVAGAAGNEQLRADVAAIAARHGLRLGEAPTPGDTVLGPGIVRIVVARSRAFVPDCPDWSGKSAANFGNSTSANYGCAVNANLAAMVADPEHLLRGADTAGTTGVMSASKAIKSWRGQEPSGAAGLPEISSRETGE